MCTDWRLFSFLTTGLSMERANGRMLHSRYLQTLQELTLTMACLKQKLHLGSGGNGGNGGNGGSGGSGGSGASGGALKNEEEEKIEDNIRESKTDPATTTNDNHQQLKFDPIHCGPSIAIGNDGQSASFSSSESWSSVRELCMMHVVTHYEKTVMEPEKVLCSCVLVIRLTATRDGSILTLLCSVLFRYWATKGSWKVGITGKFASIVHPRRTCLSG